MNLRSSIECLLKPSGGSFAWSSLRRPLRFAEYITALYIVLAFAAPLIIYVGPGVMSPAVPAFEQSAEQGAGATLRAMRVPRRTTTAQPGAQP